MTWNILHSEGFIRTDRSFRDGEAGPIFLNIKGADSSKWKEAGENGYWDRSEVFTYLTIEQAMELTNRLDEIIHDVINSQGA